MELDSIYLSNGLRPCPGATKAEMIEDLQRRNIQIAPNVGGFNDLLEAEMRKQEELVERIDSSTRGLNAKIQGILSSMENSHMKLQLQMMKQSPD